jgi:hypothetical protein
MEEVRETFRRSRILLEWTLQALPSSAYRMQNRAPIEEESKMKDGAQILIALFAGMWGSFGMALRIIEMLNNRRDIVLGIQDSHNMVPANRRQLLFADWLPLWLVGLGFTIVAMVFFLAFPDIAGGAVTGAPQLAIWRTTSLSPLHAVSYISALLAFVGFNALAWGGNADLKRMKRALQRASDDVSELTRLRERRSK